MDFRLLFVVCVLQYDSPAPSHRKLKKKMSDDIVVVVVTIWGKMGNGGMWGRTQYCCCWPLPFPVKWNRYHRRRSHQLVISRWKLLVVIAARPSDNNHDRRGGLLLFLCALLLRRGINRRKRNDRKRYAEHCALLLHTQWVAFHWKTTRASSSFFWYFCVFLKKKISKCHQVFCLYPTLTREGRSSLFFK